MPHDSEWPRKDRLCSEAFDERIVVAGVSVLWVYCSEFGVLALGVD